PLKPQPPSLLCLPTPSLGAPALSVFPRQASRPFGTPPQLSLMAVPAWSDCQNRCTLRHQSAQALLRSYPNAVPNSIGDRLDSFHSTPPRHPPERNQPDVLPKIGHS